MKYIEFKLAFSEAHQRAFKEQYENRRIPMEVITQDAVESDDGLYDYIFSDEFMNKPLNHLDIV